MTWSDAIKWIIKQTHDLRSTSFKQSRVYILYLPWEGLLDLVLPSIAV